MAAAPAVAALAAPGGGDAAPDLAQAAAVLATAAARAAGEAPALAQLVGFRVCPACAAAAHPDVSAAALACLEALLGARARLCGARPHQRLLA